MTQQGRLKLMSKIRFRLIGRRRMSNPDGPEGRHNEIRRIVTALIKHERIETFWQRGDESRGYAERLIGDAIRYGDKHKETMELASYWILEKQYVHKLFKVLAPRYENYTASYTKLWRAPTEYPGTQKTRCVIELRGNPYPPLQPDDTNNKYLIHNILLEEARKEHARAKYEAMRKKMEEQSNKLTSDVNGTAGSDSATSETVETLKNNESASSESVQVQAGESETAETVKSEAGACETSESTGTEARESSSEQIDARKTESAERVNSEEVQESESETKVNEPINVITKGTQDLNLGASDPSSEEKPNRS